MRQNCILVLLTLYLALCPVAQAAAGTLRGNLTAGPNAAPVANARVVLRGSDHEFTTSSNAEGVFEFPAAEPGANYSISIEVEGMMPYSKNGIEIGDGQTARLDVNLQLAGPHTSVLVDAGLVNLESASAEIAQTIDKTEVEELPVANRTTAKYALLDPHVRQTLGLGADYQDSMRLSINGGSYRHTSYMLDGATNYDWVYAVTPQAVVMPSAISEVKVITGDATAQYGSSTTGIIAITTPSGSNELHGDFFSFIRPSGIQATPEEALAATAAPFHVPNQRLDWGGNLGGPVVRDRTFFFASYERMQQDRGAVITLPTSSIFNGSANEYSSLARLDHSLKPDNRLTVRFNGDHYAANNTQDRISNGNQPSYGRLQRVQSWGGQVSDQAAIGNMVNVARFAYTDYFPDSATPLDPSVGVSIDHWSSTNTTAYQAGNSTYSWVHDQTETAGDTLALPEGRNSWKFGGEFVHLHVRDYSLTPDGTYSFHTEAAFEANQPYQFAQTFGAADIQYGQQEMSAFAQDEVRLTPGLKGDFGVRYEFQSITDALHNLGPRVGLAWDPIGDGKTTLRAGAGVFYDQYYMYLSRRFITLGLNPPQYNYTWSCVDAKSNFVAGVCPTYPNPSADPTGGSQSRFVSYIYIPASKLLNPYSIQVSAVAEHELNHNLIVTLSGLQIHTMKQMRVNDIDHPTPYDRTIGSAVRSTATANATRPFWDASAGTCVYQGVKGACLIDRIENTASSVYQSFDAAIKGHFQRWGQFNAHYVYAGSYATAMFYADYNSGIPSEWWTDWNELERSPSDFYQRHRIVGDAILNGPYKTMLALSGDFGSGLPVNPLTGKDDNGDGYTSDRPVGLGRNSFRTLAEKTVNLAVAKRILLHERFQAETRVEALNLMNSKNFLSVNSTYGESATPSTSFKAPETGVANTDPSRQLQFAVRLIF
jgi:hypothetical protein